MNVLRSAIVLIMVSIVLSGCDFNSDESPQPTLVEYSFFDEGVEGWVAEFADYPKGLEDSMKLNFMHSPLYVSASIGTVSALKQSGYAANSDLFMFVKQQISGLQPNARYLVTIEVELNSQLMEEYAGDLDKVEYGSFLKIGAFREEPVTMLVTDPNDTSIVYVRPEFDKGEDNQGGSDMIMIGRLEYTTPGGAPVIMNGSNFDYPLYVASDAQGKIWIAVGVDTNVPVYQEISYTFINSEFKFDGIL